MSVLIFGKNYGSEQLLINPSHEHDFNHAWSRLDDDERLAVVMVIGAVFRQKIIGLPAPYHAPFEDADLRRVEFFPHRKITSQVDSLFETHLLEKGDRVLITGGVKLTTLRVMLYSHPVRTKTARAKGDGIVVTRDG